MRREEDHQGGKDASQLGSVTVCSDMFLSPRCSGSSPILAALPGGQWYAASLNPAVSITVTVLTHFLSGRVVGTCQLKQLLHLMCAKL